MPLWECSLSACKPKDSHTGYHGEGECSQQQFAQVMFLFAAIYAMCYLFFISGVLRPGNVTKWTQVSNFPFKTTNSVFKMMTFALKMTDGNTG